MQPIPLKPAPAAVETPAAVAQPSVDSLPATSETALSHAAYVAQLVIATGVVIALLRLAEPFFVPLLVGILTSYTLGPLVATLRRCGVPCGAGALLVLGVLVALMLGGVYSLSDDAARFADELPSTAKRIRQLLHERLGGTPTALSNVNKAAAELERAANEASGNKLVLPATPAESSVAWLKHSLMAGTSGVVGRLAELVVALLIAYFLLAAGDTFKRKVARIAGPSLARRRVTVEVLDEVHEQIQRYMLLLVATNALIGLAIWGLFAALGVPGAGLWGLTAGLLHIVPYAGAALLATAAALAGLIQFGTLAGAALLGGSALGIATLIGIGLQTWLNSRVARINPVVVFGGLLFFGWLWGAWGLLLAPPLLAVFRVVAERVEAMNPIAELMRE